VVPEGWITVLMKEVEKEEEKLESLLQFVVLFDPLVGASHNFFFAILD